jgi:glycosyltransferase involved in cell wall biosynthesis
VYRKDPKTLLPSTSSQAADIVAPPNENYGGVSTRACKKILFVSSSNEYGGAEKHLLELVRRLRGPSVQLYILCFQTDFFTARLGPDRDIEVITCTKAPQFLGDWVRLFRDIRPDVVVFVYGWFWAIPCAAVVGAWVAGVRRRFSIQHLMTPQISVPPQALAALRRERSLRGRLRGVLRKLLGRQNPAPWPLWLVASMNSAAEIRRSAHFYNTTICVSDALRHSLLKDFGFPAGRVKTIHNGVSISEFVPSDDCGSDVRERLGCGQDEFVLVCVARLSEQKRIDVLLEALARVLREGFGCKCIIVGDGPGRNQLREQARSIGLSGHVFFEGFHEDVRPYLQAGSAFILTSDTEGLPLSILEAMACGLPSIVTDVGGNAELITHRVHGMIVPRESVDAIAEAISYLANHPEERAQMAKMARAKACEAFDIEKAMAEIREVILS